MHHHLSPFGFRTAECVPDTTIETSTLFDNKGYWQVGVWIGASFKLLVYQSDFTGDIEIA